MSHMSTKQSKVTKLSPQDLEQLARQLRSQLAMAREQIRLALLRRDTESYAQLAGQVHNSDEEALAGVLVDVNLAEIARETDEARTINAALARIRSGSYGVCVECGEPIDEARLRAYPAANRCLTCQRSREGT